MAYVIGCVLPEIGSVANIVTPLHATSLVCFVLASAFFNQKALVYLCFVVFECCVGVYFPAHGTIRSIHLPDNRRSSIMQLFGFPMWLVVLTVLQLNLPMQTVVALIVVFQGISLACLWLFRQAVAEKADADETAQRERERDPLLKPGAMAGPPIYGTLLRNTSVNEIEHMFAQAAAATPHGSRSATPHL